MLIISPLCRLNIDAGPQRRLVHTQAQTHLYTHEHARIIEPNTEEAVFKSIPLSQYHSCLL